jgi:rod shape determining protein RodA
MVFDRRILIHFDFLFFGLVLAILGIGVLNLYSSGNALSEATGKDLYLKQIQWVVIGLIFSGLLLVFHYHLLGNAYVAWCTYGAALLLLLLVLVLGREVSGSKRWLQLGSFSLQPSELVRLSVVILLAKIFSGYEGYQRIGLKDLFVPFLIVGVPFLLVLKQPDLGTALLLFLVAASLLVLAPVRWGPLLVIGGIGAGMVPFLWNFLKDYQKRRIVSFLSPEQDPLGSGYHLIQSKIAVGSGGFLGKGFMEGTQSQLKFLPEQHTDFAFSVLAEEWGFLGCLVLLVLFLFIILYGLNIARHSRDRFGTFLTIGITASFFWPFLINLSMVTGMLPVVGIPLPFISYGGSSMVVHLIEVGILLNIQMRRYLFHR